MIKIFDLGSFNLIPLEEFLIYKGYKNEEIHAYCYEPNSNQHIHYKINSLVEYFKKEYLNLSLTISRDAIYTKMGVMNYIEHFPMQNWKFHPLTGKDWWYHPDDIHPASDCSYISSPIIQSVVNTVDFNTILEDNVEENDEVYIRMDIEGCEYNVLAQFLENEELCKKVKEIYIEWHHFYWKKGSINDSKRVYSYAGAENILSENVNYDLRKNLKKLFCKQLQQYDIEVKDLVKTEGFDPNDDVVRKEIVERRNKFLEK